MTGAKVGRDMEQGYGCDTPILNHLSVRSSTGGPRIRDWEGGDGHDGYEARRMPQGGTLTLTDARRAIAGAIVPTLVMSGAVNVILLAGPLYMLQVYDRVLTSHSIQTLVALTVILVVANAALGFIDSARAQLLRRAGLRLDRLLASDVMRIGWQPTSGSDKATGSLLDQLYAVQRFIGGPGMLAWIDLIWTPLFIVVIALIHPWLGAFAIGSTALLILIAGVQSRYAAGRLNAIHGRMARVRGQAAEMAEKSETIRAHGMGEGLLADWQRARDGQIVEQAKVDDWIGLMKSLTRSVRLTLQSLILGLGALLVLHNEMSAGGIIAASLLLGRALTPVDQVLATLPQLSAAHKAYRRLGAALDEQARHASRSIALPRLTGEVAARGLAHFYPGMQRPALTGIDFDLAPGEFLGVCGPSGSGKTTLARLLVGTIQPVAGKVLFDNVESRAADRPGRASSIGYLDQEAELLAASVKSNIARFCEADDREIATAAKMAGAHELIMSLPQGYDTIVSPGCLSTGQRHMIALARALMGSPSVLVLDSPDAHFDDQGMQRLIDTIAALRGKGVSGVIVTNKIALLSKLDKLLLLREGRAFACGAREAVICHLTKTPAMVAPTLVPQRSPAQKASA